MREHKTSSSRKAGETALKAAAPYRPKARRDPEVTLLFWQGVYYGISVGLLVGIAVWGFLMLGGGPLATDRARAMSTLLTCGGTGLLFACVWVWGRKGLAMTGNELVERIAGPLEWLVWPFVPGEEEDEREQVVTGISRSIASAVLAAPAGIPVMVAVASAGKIKRLALWPLALLASAGAVTWVLLLVVAGKWLLVVPAPPSMPSGAEMAAAKAEHDLQSAEMDSALQLAVARSQRAKERGDRQEAIRILEAALRNAEVQGRSVSHVQLHWNLAWLYAAEGDDGAAMMMFRTVIDLGEPGSDMQREAADALRRIARRAGIPVAAPSSRTPILEEDLAEDAYRE